MPAFIGLDLAWGKRNPHGYCVLEGDGGDIRCTFLGARSASVEVLAESVTRVASRSEVTLVSIDAPLLFPRDPSVERPIDVDVCRLFERYKVRPLSGQKSRNRGQTAGLELGEALRERGFTLDPSDLLAGARPERVAFEVFPHTIHVRLFRLSQQLFYKHGTPSKKRRGLGEYQRHLRRTLDREAPGLLDSGEIREVLDEQKLVTAREEEAIKQLDDTLDGLTCALSAFLAWSKPEEWEMLGDMTGYMVMPRAGRQ